MKFLATVLLINCFAAFGMGLPQESNSKISTLDLHRYEHPYDHAYAAPTTVDISSYGTQFLLNLPLDDLEANTNNCTESPHFYLSNVTWTVRACIRSFTGTDRLNVFLVSDISNPTWASEATANFKLFYNHSEARYFQRLLDWSKFSSSSESHGILHYLGDNNNLEYYITDRKLRFEIEVTTKPLQVIVEKNMERTGTKVRAVLKNVSNLKYSSAYSSQVAVRGIRWTVVASLLDGYFRVNLLANNEDLDLDWSTNVTIRFKIMPYNTHITNIKPIEVTLKNTYRKNLNEFGTPLYEFKHFIDPTYGYVINDTSVMLIEFEVSDKDPIWGNEISYADNN